MAEIDVNAYATTAANAAAGAPTVVETQQPGGTGALRQVMAIGDPTTRTSIQTVKPASTAAVATDLPAVVALHPTSPLPAGTNKLGTVQAVSSTTGGLTPFTLISAATTNATSVKATAGTVYSIQASNTGAAVAFLKLFNLATAPTVGTSVAVKTLIIPAGGGIVVPINDIGLAFGTGISFSTTGLATTADTTVVALAQVVVNIDYI